MGCARTGVPMLRVSPGSLESIPTNQRVVDMSVAIAELDCSEPPWGWGSLVSIYMFGFPQCRALADLWRGSWKGADYDRIEWVARLFCPPLEELLELSDLSRPLEGLLDEG